VKTKPLASLYRTFGALCFHKAKEWREMSTSIRNWNEFLKFVDDVFTGKSPEIKLSGIDTRYSVPIKVTREGNDRISIDRGNFTNLCAECFVRGEDSLYDEVLEAYKSGNIKTIDQFMTAVNTLNEQRNELRTKLLARELADIQKKEKKRRGKTFSDAQLKEAKSESKSWSQLGYKLEVSDKKAKDLWREYCERKGIPFKDESFKPSE
jgi:hypothetical protein